MKRATRIALCRTAALAATVATSQVLAQPSFKALGDFAGGTFYSDAWRVADDGRSVAGGGSPASGTPCTSAR